MSLLTPEDEAAGVAFLRVPSGYVPSAGARSEPPGTAAGVVDFRQYSAQLAPEAEQQRF